jgi:hypothetical protein
LIQNVLSKVSNVLKTWYVEVIKNETDYIVLTATPLDDLLGSVAKMDNSRNGRYVGGGV